MHDLQIDSVIEKRCTYIRAIDSVIRACFHAGGRHVVHGDIVLRSRSTADSEERFPVKTRLLFRSIDHGRYIYIYFLLTAFWAICMRMDPRSYIQAQCLNLVPCMAAHHTCMHAYMLPFAAHPCRHIPGLKACFARMFGPCIFCNG